MNKSRTYIDEWTSPYRQLTLRVYLENVPKDAREVISVHFIHENNASDTHEATLLLPKDETKVEFTFANNFQAFGSIATIPRGSHGSGLFLDLKYGSRPSRLAHANGIFLMIPHSVAPGPIPPDPDPPIPPAPDPPIPPAPDPPLPPDPIITEEHDIFPYISVRLWPDINAYDLRTQFVQYAPLLQSPPRTSLFTELVALRAKLPTDPETRIKMEERAVGYIDNSPQYISNLTKLEGTIRRFAKLYEVLQGVKEYNYETLLGVTETILGADQATLRDYLRSPKYRRERDRVWQSYFALVVVLGYNYRLLREFTTVLVTANFLDVLFFDLRLAAKPSAMRSLIKATIILPIFHDQLQVGAEQLFPLPPVLTGQPVHVKSKISPFAIGDLQVVRRYFLRYVLGDLAHIENVLRGERRQTHRRKLTRDTQSQNDTEYKVVESLDTREESNADLQTAIQRILARNSLTGDYQDLKTTYGPPTSVTFGGSVTYTENPDKDSPFMEDQTAYAKQVLNESISRITRVVQQQRASTHFTESEESVTSVFDNVGKDKNVRGIYRWLDKILSARVVWYGSRMMIEFLVPDPARDYILSEARLRGVNYQRPAPFPFQSFAEVTPENFAAAAAQFNVRDIEPPPDPRMVADSMQGEGELQIAIPPGFIAEKAWLSYALPESVPLTLDGAIGRQPFHLPQSDETEGTLPIAMNKEDSAVNVVVTGRSQLTSPPSALIDFALSVQLHCVPSRQRMQAWQIATYNAIRAGYEREMEHYFNRTGSRDQIGQAQHRPVQNRNIERRVLKRECILALLARREERVGPSLLNPDGNLPGREGIFNAPAYVQFLTQIFEWSAMTWTFSVSLASPEFKEKFAAPRSMDSSQKGRLYELLPGEEAFTTFLQASWARVLVPVQPERNLALLYFLSSGMAWNIEDRFAPVNPADVTLASELKRLAAHATAPELRGESWKVRVPTSFLYLDPSKGLFKRNGNPK
ncbi:MAG: hypothetical protein AAF998_19360 [Bacteroidota bacterium]